MNTMPNDYVTKKYLDEILDRMLKQFFEYVNVVTEGMAERIEKRFDQKLLKTANSLKVELGAEIDKVRKDLQNYQENNSRTLVELKAMNREIKTTNEELKDMNKNILGLISYQESRLRVVEKKAHTHSTDML